MCCVVLCCFLPQGPLQNVPCQLSPQSDGTVAATYVPRETGAHNVDIRLDGKPIEGQHSAPARSLSSWLVHV